MNAPRHGIYFIAAELLAQLMWGPKTRAELEAAVIDSKNGTLSTALEQFHASGVIYIESYDHRLREVYKLQPTPFERSDAPIPHALADRICVPGRQPVRVHMHQGKAMTVRQLADSVGCSYETMWSRLKTMTPEQAVALGAPLTKSQAAARARGVPRVRRSPVR